MKTKLKSEKGAITMIVLVSVLFLTTLLISIYIGVANKARTSAETTKQIAEKYNNIGEADAIYSSYLADGNTIPIYTAENLMNIDNEQITEFEANGKIYKRNSNSVFVLMGDITIDASKYTDFTTTTISSKIGKVKFDGLGHQITVNNLGGKTYVLTKANSWLG